MRLPKAWKEQLEKKIRSEYSQLSPGKVEQIVKEAEKEVDENDNTRKD